jgi:soluble lytic murein transglycosylase-like protein
MTRLIRLVALALLTTLVAPLAGRPAGWAQETSSDSSNLYVRAAASAGVPLELLVAIAGAESGYHPWALNLGGHEVYCQSRAEAEQRLVAADHVAIGLMQINWGYWGQRLGLSKAELLDPETNLTWGGRILKDGMQHGASLWDGISNYHSGSSETRYRYNQLVYNSYQRYLRGDVGRRTVRH